MSFEDSLLINLEQFVGGGGVPDPTPGRILPRAEGSTPVPDQQLRRDHVDHPGEDEGGNQGIRCIQVYQQFLYSKVKS